MRVSNISKLLLRSKEIILESEKGSILFLSLDVIREKGQKIAIGICTIDGKSMPCNILVDQTEVSGELRYLTEGYLQLRSPRSDLKIGNEYAFDLWLDQTEDSSGVPQVKVNATVIESSYSIEAEESGNPPDQIEVEAQIFDKIQFKGVLFTFPQNHSFIGHCYLS